MTKKLTYDIHKKLLEGHRRGVEKAIDDSIRTGVPLVIAEDGKIIEIKPKYKYVKVPIRTLRKKKSNQPHKMKSF